jgi:electron transport complex protein RnfC
VRIGTRIGEVFAECGGFVGEPRRIATGSPLQGRIVADLDEPVVKTSYAVFAMLDSQAGAFNRQNCIGCGECRMVCPVGLDPEELYKKTAGGAAASPAAEIPTAAPVISSSRCHGCGCCELVCPSRLPLAAVIYSAEASEVRQ